MSRKKQVTKNGWLSEQIDHETATRISDYDLEEYVVVIVESTMCDEEKFIYFRVQLTKEITL